MRRFVQSIGLALMLSACGNSVDTPDVVYEQGLNTEKYVDCMTQLLTLDTQCRFQRDSDVFEACMLVHSDYCRQQGTEVLEAGVK